METHPDAHRLTDLIYAALLGEQPWQAFLDATRSVLPNGKALLFFHDAAAGTGAFGLNSGFDPEHLTAYGAHYSGINPWMEGACIRELGRVVRADSMLPRDRLLATEFYNDFLRPQGLEAGIGVTMLRDTHCNFMLSVLSAPAGDAEFDDAIRCIEGLVPHLRRAFESYRRPRTGLEPLGESWLEGRLRFGAISVGAGRKVRSVKAPPRLMNGLDELRIDCVGRLQCSEPGVVDCLDDMLSRWMRDREKVPPRSFLLSDRSPPVRLTVVSPPLEEDAGYFRGPECLVLLEELRTDARMAVEELGARHKLTAAEKRLVSGLVAGLSLNEIAARSGTAPGTVRTQLKHVFAKTGTSRQVDLVRDVCLLAATLVDLSGAS